MKSNGLVFPRSFHGHQDGILIGFDFHESIQKRLADRDDARGFYKTDSRGSRQQFVHDFDDAARAGGMRDKVPHVFVADDNLLHFGHRQVLDVFAPQQLRAREDAGAQFLNGERGQKRAGIAVLVDLERFCRQQHVA